MGFTGKVALVTGGAQGLGKAFTKVLLQNGVKVAMLDVQANKGQETLREFETDFGSTNVTFVKTDVTNQEEFEGAFKAAKDKFGGLDIVINNAGVSGEALDRWERTVDINLKGTIRGTLLAMDHLRIDKGGRGGVVLNVASITAVRPNPCGPTYAATKVGLMNYSLSWAMNPEVIKNGIRINVLCPAFADTSMTQSLSGPGNSLLPELVNQLVSQKTFMTPEFVATNMLELLDEDLKKHGQVMLLSAEEGKSYHTR